MKVFLTALLCLGLTAGLFAKSGPADAIIRGDGGNSLDTRWGPDAFGYRGLDSQEQGGPQFGWIDISTSGTEVEGLTDDNFVGPFNIGWAFHYYWYDVTQFWVGSNGYIKFSTPGQLAQPIPRFPTATTPNDVVGVYCADWLFDPAATSECYWWTNNDDTLIVSWDNTEAWDLGGSHDFQLILSGVDSSITFMYGPQNGTVSNDNTSVGVENLTGQIGISCFFGTYPSPNYAIKFMYPDTITFAIHDLAISGVQNAGSQGFFLLEGQQLLPWLAVRNAGNQAENSYTAVYSVRQLNNQLVASEDTTMGTIAPSTVHQIQFPAIWTAGAPNNYRVTGRVNLTGDALRANDSVRVEMHTMRLPGDMRYDDGTAERFWGWSGGNGGMANEFEPPAYPVTVTSVSYFVGETGGFGFQAQILDDDGPDGAPGTLIWSQDVASPTPNEVTTVQVPENEVVITAGSFYVAWWQTSEGIQFGLDTTSAQGIARRSWEGAGGWAENRLAQEADPMIWCRIESSTGPNEPPTAPLRLQPADNDTIDYPRSVTFNWSRSTDADGDPITYYLRVWSPNHTGIRDTVFAVPDTFYQYQMPGAQPADRPFFNINWRLWASDEVDSTEASNGQGRFVLLNPVAAGDLPSSVALEYRLSNYPNPFNPSTALNYEIAQAGVVTLKVYDLNGREVATLVNGHREPGRYQITWNAEAFPSGTYFAVLESQHQTRMLKLLLLK